MHYFHGKARAKFPVNPLSQLLNHVSAVSDWEVGEEVVTSRRSFQMRLDDVSTLVGNLDMLGRENKYITLMQQVAAELFKYIIKQDYHSFRRGLPTCEILHLKYETSSVLCYLHS